MTGAFSASATFGYTGSVRSWTIPAGTTQLVVTSDGATGADGGSAVGQAGGAGGVGEQVVTTVPVGGSSPFQPGDTLDVLAGGQGGAPQLSDFAGGDGGGSDGTVFTGAGGQGGGGSGVADTTVSGWQWINVADGGGGGGGASDGLDVDSGSAGGSGYEAGDPYFLAIPGGAQPDVCGTPPDPLATYTWDDGLGGGNAGTASGGGGGGGAGGGCLGGNGGAAGSYDDHEMPGAGGSTGAPWTTSLGTSTEGNAPSGNGSVTIQCQGIPQLPSPSLAATSNPNSVALGSAAVTLKGAAVLSEGNKPTGTLTFTLYQEGNWSPVDTEKVTVDGDGTYATQTGYTLPTTGTVAGHYQWDVTYSGDSNNSAVSLDDDPVAAVQVRNAQPTLTATASPPTVDLGSAPVTLKDTATLVDGYSPTGTITFRLDYGTTAVDTETVPVNGNGTYATPTGYTLPGSGTVAGAYQWDVAYAPGDGNNSAVADDGDAGGQVTVSPAATTLTTTPSAASLTYSTSPQALRDYATVAGGDGPTGQVTFTLYYDGGTTPVDTETVAVNGNGTYATPNGYTLPAAGQVTGSYQWDVTYSGDGNNAGASDLAARGRLTVGSGRGVGRPGAAVQRGAAAGPR